MKYKTDEILQIAAVEYCLGAMVFTKSPYL